MSASCVLRQEVLDTDAAIPNQPLSPRKSAPVNNLRTGTCPPISKTPSISFLFLRSRSTKLPAPLAAFVPIPTYPVETHDIGGVFHHAFSHCRFDRHILSVVFRDLFVVCPHTGGTRAPEQFSGTLFGLRENYHRQRFAIYLLAHWQPEFQQPGVRHRPQHQD